MVATKRDKHYVNIVAIICSKQTEVPGALIPLFSPGINNRHIRRIVFKPSMFSAIRPISAVIIIICIDLPNPTASRF